MIHHTLPKDKAIVDHYADASSMYSDDTPNDVVQRPCPDTPEGHTRTDYRVLDPAEPYRAIVAEVQTKTWPGLPRSDIENYEDTFAEQTCRKSRPLRTRRDDVKLAQSVTLSKSGLQSTSSSTYGKLKPNPYVEPRCQTKGNLKAIRFQDTANGLADPTKDLKDTQVTRPIWADESPATYSYSVHGSHSVQTLRRSGFRHHESALQPVTASDQGRPEDLLDCEQARATVKGELPVYHPLRNVPVRKGWVKKVAQAITDRGQNE